METWRPILGFEGIYEVSDLGRVKRIAPDTRGNPRFVGRIITPHTTAAGYLRVTLCRDAKATLHFVHRLVARTFLGEAPQGKPTVNHLDGDKANPRLANLEWASYAENYRHALDTLGFKPPRGTAHWNAKRTPEDVAEIKCRVAAGESQRAVARSFRMAQGNVSMIVNGKLWA